MKLKRFEALTLHGALRAVKAELGPDAVIVSSRRIQKGGGLFGLLSQPVVEVTAAVDRTKSPDRPELAQSEESHEERNIGETAGESITQAVQKGVDQRFESQLQMATMLDPVTQQLSALQEELKQLRQERENPEAVIGPLRQELEGLRIVVGDALGDRMRRQVGDLPGDVLGEYEALIREGVQPQLAHDLLRSVVETLGSAGLSNQHAVQEVLGERMEESISVSGSLLPVGGLQKVVMLVGPTGVGKTTTIAKLASWATKAERPCHTVLITLDTYRVAAVEQLRVFAKILKVPLEVAVSPGDLTACIHRHHAADLILIDTAGRSPRDGTGQEELRAIARQNLKIETHLVVAAPTAESLLHDVVRRYQTVPVHRLLVTKLDEAKTYGSLFNLLHYTGIPLSYLSMGQRVPEDLELARKKKIVGLTFGAKSEDPPTHQPLEGAIA